MVVGPLKHSRAFFDDITTGTNAEDGKDAFDVHLFALEELFKTLLKHRLRLEPAKCFYGYKDVKALGFRVRVGVGISPLTSHVEPIINMVPPTTKSAVRSFLGAAQVYSSFIPQYAEIAQPITELTKGSKSGAMEP